MTLTTAYKRTDWGYLRWSARGRLRVHVTRKDRIRNEEIRSRLQVRQDVISRMSTIFICQSDRGSSLGNDFMSSGRWPTLSTVRDHIRSPHSSSCSFLYCKRLDTIQVCVESMGTFVGAPRFTDQDHTPMTLICSRTTQTNGHRYSPTSMMSRKRWVCTLRGQRRSLRTLVKEFIYACSLNAG